MDLIPLQTNVPTSEQRRISLLDLSYAELVSYMAGLGQPKFRARQVWDWIYKRYAGDFESMTNLPTELRARLTEQATVFPLR